MNNVYVVTTFDSNYEKDGYNAETAVDAWKECGVCAIGWSGIGNLKEKSDDEIKLKLKETYKSIKGFNDIKDFLQIEKGDLILAYSNKNTIAYVGEVVGDYVYTRDNKIGNENEIDYANQFSVNWWNSPHHFDRHELPSYIYKQLGKRGKTVIKLNFKNKSFDELKNIIKVCAISGSQLNALNESLIKVGLSKYLKQNLNLIENGLKIIKAEVRITPKNQPDFIAEDINGKKVIIECKGTASGRDLYEKIKYKKTYIKECPRLMLIAFKFSDDCKKAAKDLNVELIECDLSFKKLN